MLKVLKNRAFRDLWLGQAISQMGDSFYYVVFMFMIDSLTGNPAMVGFVGVAETLPFLLFSAYGGVLADRFDRRMIMLVSDVLSGLFLLTFAALALMYGKDLPVWTLFAAALLTSSVRSVFLPAKSAAIPALVKPEEIVPANSLSYMTQSWMPMIGLFLSASILGVLYAHSAKWFFVAAISVNALSFFVSASYIRRLPRVVPDRDSVSESHPWSDFKDGLQYISKRGALKVLMVLSVLMSLMISPFMVAFVNANRSWFGGKPNTLAWCEFTFFAGLIVGGIATTKLNIRRPGLGYIMALSVCGLSVAAMAFSTKIYLFCLCNIVAGLAIPFADIPVMNYVQVTVEDAFRGRVNSVLTMMRMSIAPLGLGLGGLLIVKFGLVGMFLFMGLGMVGVALLGFLSHAFRTSEMPAVSESAGALPSDDHHLRGLGVEALVPGFSAGHDVLDTDPEPAS